MARVVVVSRNPGMALAFAPDHVAVAVSREDLGQGDLVDADVIVIDLGDPATSVEVAEAARAQRPGLPVVLVADDDPQWSALPLDSQDRTRLVPLPVSRASLFEAVASLTALAPASQAAEPAPEPASDPAPAPAPAPEPAPDPVKSLTPVSGPDMAPEMVPTAVARSRALLGRGTTAPTLLSQRLAGLPRTASAAADDLRSLMAPPSPSTAPRERHAPPIEPPSAAPLATAPRVTAASSRSRRSQTTSELVDTLMLQADLLFGVPETATVLAVEAAERAGAEACAVLVPDGPRWRVSGGVALRPLEHRLELDEHHWLVREVADARHGVLVQGTDIARRALAGAPLASWENLMAVPVPTVRGVVVLARHASDPFTERELDATARTAAEAGPLLAAAVANRALARVLAPLTDVEAPNARGTHSV